MYRITDARFLTVIIITGTAMIPALYMLGLYVFSDASPKKGMGIVTAFPIWGAFFFGFFSSSTPLQLFSPAVANNAVLFPTGMIPLFLVPIAIFFHTLSILNYSKFELR